MTDETVSPVAVVGLSARLPGAADVDAFWRLLHDSRDAITEASEQRWPSAVLPEYRHGGFVADVADFDAAFFGISPAEAAAMDPQQRLVLELAWHALEDARIVPEQLRGSGTGVFVGAIANDYATLAVRAGAEAAHSYAGTHRAIIANRVSYVLGLRGPSLTVDSGQSASLVAVQLACESLRRGESRIALAGGVNLNLLAETTAAIGRFGALSPDGRCHVFDARANGYVRGEGGALVVLKPLAAALSDGDVVHAVILGGAINNDGGGEGLTAPDADAQREVIARARACAGVAAGDVDYVELHGAGTAVGDPIEAAALGGARPTDAPLLVGSAKTNVGHLEGAAGIVGLLKVILAIRHRELPASLHFATPHPRIPLGELHLEVVTATRAWPRPDRRLLAGVSSFGMGGTNCHLVVGEAPARQPAGERSARPDVEESEPAELPWLVSARSQRTLRDQATNLRPIAAASGVRHALARTRTFFEHRAVAFDLTGLDALAAGDPHPSLLTGRAGAGRTVFTFPGQGSQWAGMAADLLAESAEFARHLNACAQALAPFCDVDLLDVLRSGADLDRVDVVQPALWAVMVSLAQLWRAAGVEPSIVIGHSQGEIAAATVIGALSLEDAARVVALRSRAIAGIAGIAGSGGMLSVAAPADVVAALRHQYAPGVGVAASNGPDAVVLSGSRAELVELEGQFTVAGYRAKLIAVDYASHSAAVEPLRERLLAELAPIRPTATTTTFVSTLTGAALDTAELDAAYWYASLRQPVQFAAATRHALELGAGVFVEASPHPVLVAAVEASVDQARQESGQRLVAGDQVAVVGTLRRGEGDLFRFRRSVAEAWVAGASVDWTGPSDLARCELPALPGYPFDRRRYWLGEQPVAARPVAVRSRAELLDLVLAVTAEATGRAELRVAETRETFKQLGVDSITAVEIRNRLRTALARPLPVGVLFDHPTPADLVDHLAAHVPAASTETGPAATETGPAATEPSDTAPSDTAPAETQPAQTQPGETAMTVDRDPIAIVGIGCRYPGGVAGAEDLWRLVEQGRDATGEFPTDRGWDLDALFAADPDQPGASATRRGGFLDGVGGFDAEFFGISPREALAMDPQQRLLLEIGWEALERAGIDPQQLRGSATGVFVGAMAPDYGPRLHQPTGTADGHLLTGTALSVISGRLAYVLGLEGPAVTVDTACSSSLVALHLAAQALRRGECTLALAGGVTVMSTPGMFVEFSRQRGLSTDGRCKAFAADADGTGWSEGAGILVLQRLSDARRAGRPVLAVIRGSAVNQDGRSNGLTAPNGPSQERVIGQALADAGLVPGDVDAVEAHGTGTTLGDPIEANALIEAYGAGRDPSRPLWLGSVKSNLGHTQAAAGVAGVIKMVEALRHRTLPATLHVDAPTPHVDWDSAPLRLLRGPVALADGERRARVGVSAFGISGTNAHVILEQADQIREQAEQADQIREQAQPADQPPTQHGPYVWAFSARTATALRAHATRLAEFARDVPDPGEVGRALAARSRFAHRAVVLAADRDQLRAGLRALIDGQPHPGVFTAVAADDVRAIFVFPGQGSQWAGMAAGLLDDSEVFWDWMCRCDAALGAYVDWSVLDVLRQEDGAPTLSGSDVVQPVLFAVMVSLAALWRSVGVDPVAVMGHSQGEITAACVAGALSLDDAARIVALRSKALLTLTGTGGMIAVAVSAAEAAAQIQPWRGRLWVAIHSGPRACVVAGDLDALEEFAARCDASAQPRRVAIDYAAHTPHIEQLRDTLAEILTGLSPESTDVAFCSAATGGFLAASELGAEYWFRGLRQPVLFTEAVGAAAAAGTPLFVEASPHPALTTHIGETLRVADAPGHAVGTLRRGAGDRTQFLAAAAEAFVHGAPVDWAALLGRPSGPAEPTYPFEHRRYWLDASPPAGAIEAGGATVRHPLLGAVLRLADEDGYLILGRLSRTSTPWLAEHVVDGAALLPGTAFVELAGAAARLVGCDTIDELTLTAALPLPESAAVAVQIRLGAPDAYGRRAFGLHARPADDCDADWTPHATGTLSPARTATTDQPADLPLHQADQQVSEPVDVVDVYAQLADRGYDYGPSFQGLRSLGRAGSDTWVEVALPDAVDAEGFGVHPALLDAVLHVLVLDRADASTLLLPFAWRDVSVRADAGAVRALRVRIRETGADQVALDGYDAKGRWLLGVGALTLRRLNKVDVAPTGYVLDWVAPDGVDGVAPDGVAVDGLDGSAGDGSDTSPDGRELTGQVWATVGDAADIEAGLRHAGAQVAGYYDLPSLADLSADGVPRVVVAPYPDPDVADLPYAVHEGLTDLLDLVQAWVGDERFAGSTLLIMTGTQLGSAAAWGLIRSAATEHPGRFAIAGLPAGFAAWGRLAGALAAGETQLVYRDGALLVPRLTPRPAPQPTTLVTPEPTTPPTEPAQSAVDGAGTVLVTGGTRGIGALVAQHLVSAHGVRHLLLVSRHGERTEGVDKLVATLTGLGAQVRVAAADVADRRALAHVLDEIPDEHPLVGVVHAAGIVDDAPVERLSARQLDDVLAAKVDGAWNLHELTRELPLTWFVMFSSVAGVLGTAGQANYAAANAFLDQLAAHRRASGRCGIALAWGLWDVDTGMSAGLTDADRARLARAGVAPLPVADGLALFDQALGVEHASCVEDAVCSADAMCSGDAVLVAASFDQSGLRARAAEQPVPPPLRGLVRTPRRASAAIASHAPRRPGDPTPAGATAVGATGTGVTAAGATGTGVTAAGASGTSAGAGGELAARLAALPPKQARQQLHDLISQHVATVLAFPDVDAVDPGQAFGEMGFDSLTAVELRNRLDAATGLRLPATLAFDHPTVRALVDHVLATLAPAPPTVDETLRAALDGVYAQLADSDDAARGKVVALLSAALSRLESLENLENLESLESRGNREHPNGQAGPAGSAVPAGPERLRDASDDEIFAYIDTQL